MKKLIIILFLLPFSLLSQVDTTQKSLVNWMTIEKAEQLHKITPKPMLISVYTGWCSWCKHMLKTTYSNPDIASYINTNFYPVQINAETNDTLTFLGEQYVKNGKYNQLAIDFLDGKMSFPSSVFLSRDLRKLIVPGYLKVAQIQPFLVYFAEDLMYSVDIADFRIDYIYRFPQSYTEELSILEPNQKLDTLGESQWLTFEEAFEKSKTEKKKYLLFSYVDWSFSSNIMKKIAFSNTIIAEMINENYYLIPFNAATEKTITINDKEYKSLGEGQPNELAMELFQKQFSFPAIIVLDEDFQLLSVVRGYFTSKQLEPLLSYFSADLWKTMTNEEFMETFESKL